MATSTAPAVDVSRVGDFSKALTGSFDKVAELLGNSATSGNLNEEWDMLRTRWNALRNASKDIAFEIIAGLGNRFKSVLALVEAVSNDEERAKAVKELEYFTNDRYAQFARTLSQSFATLKTDMEAFLQKAPEYLKDQIREMIDTSITFAEFWEMIRSQTTEFYVSIQGALESVTLLRLKKEVRTIAKVAEEAVESLEGYRQDVV